MPFAFSPVALSALLAAALLQPTPAGSPASAPAATPAAATTAATGPKVTITVNSDDAPDLKDWGDKAKDLCEAWYPRIAEELKSDGFTPRDSVVILFKKEMKAPAATSGGTISVNAEYVRNHPKDVGMMVHELTHVVQAYGHHNTDLGWLTEGIADYIRFWLYEPQVRQAPINKEKASYKNSYRISAAFLGWLTDKYDKRIVNKLNAKLRAGGADASIFKDILGKSVDDLWQEFIAAGAPSQPELAAASKTLSVPNKSSPTEPAPSK